MAVIFCNRLQNRGLGGEEKAPATKKKKKGEERKKGEFFGGLCHWQPKFCNEAAFKASPRKVIRRPWKRKWGRGEEKKPRTIAMCLIVKSSTHLRQPNFALGKETT